MTPLTGALIPESQASEVASTDMKKAAMQIAQQCLRRWDAALGVRPGTDAGGAKAESGDESLMVYAVQLCCWHSKGSTKICRCSQAAQVCQKLPK